MDIQIAIAEFLDQVRSSQAHNTALAYGSALNKFRAFLAKSKRTQLDVEAVIAFAGFLNGNVAQATKSNYLTALSRLYHYLVGKRALKPDAFELEQMREFLKRATKAGEHLPKLPADEIVEQLRRAARAVEPTPSTVESERKRRELQRLRNIAFIEALRSSGMRVGELVGLRIGDLNVSQQTARVTGKGNKQRDVFLDEAWKAIRDYLGARGETTDDQPLFARHSRNAGDKVLPLTTDTVRNVFHALIAKSDMDAITPHQLRHWLATKVLNATGDLALTQDMLGHNSPQTTRVYAKVSAVRMANGHRRAFEKED